MHSKTIHKTHDFQSLVDGEPRLFNNIKENVDLENITLEAHPWLHKGFTQVEGLQVTSLLPWGYVLQNTKSLMSPSLYTKDKCEDKMDDLGKEKLLDFPSLCGRPL